METLFRPEWNDQPANQFISENEIREVNPDLLEFWESVRRFDAYILECPTTVKKHIDNHPLLQKSTDYYAELTEIDRRILQRVFKRQFHLTISQYQLQKRMEVAATLLQAGRLSHKQIASKCGYRNVNNFSRAFKKAYKQSPSNFLRLLYKQLPDSEDIRMD